MKKREPKDAGAKHPFFHAMVVMGGSAAVGCGGIATATRHDGVTDAPDASVPGEASGGNAGSSALRTGGGGSGGFASNTSNGGTAMAGGADSGEAATSAPEFAKCVPPKWTCTGFVAPFCDNPTISVELPRACTCDETRPANAADCAPGQTFVCRRGTYTLPTTIDAATPIVPFECSCVTAPPDCSTCREVFGMPAGTDYLCDSAEHDGGVGDLLCGCAVIYLR